MNRFFSLLLVLSITVLLTGCPGPIKGDAEMQQLIAAMDAAASATDPSDALAKAERVDQIRSRIESLNLSREEKATLRARYAAQLARFKK